MLAKQYVQLLLIQTNLFRVKSNVRQAFQLFLDMLNDLCIGGQVRELSIDRMLSRLDRHRTLKEKTYFEIMNKMN